MGTRKALIAFFLLVGAAHAAPKAPVKPLLRNSPKDLAALNVRRMCHGSEIHQLFLPGVDLDQLPSEETSRVCSTMSSLFKFMGVSEKATAQLAPYNPSHVGISFRCWKSVAEYWSHSKMEFSKNKNLHFLAHDLAATMKLFREEAPPSAEERSAWTCPRMMSMDKEFLAHIDSVRNVIAHSLLDLGCDQDESMKELNAWAERLLIQDFPGDMFPSCRDGGPGKPSALQRYVTCRKMKRDIEGLIRGTIQQNKKINHTELMQGCLNAVPVVVGNETENWKSLQQKCDPEHVQQIVGNLSTAMAMNDQETIARGKPMLDNLTSSCGPIHQSCTEMISAAYESRRSDNCPIERGFGKQTAATCFFNALSGAIYAKSPGCPAQDGRRVSIGELQNAAGMGEEWVKDRGAGAAETAALQKRFPVPGLKLTTSKTAFNGSKVPPSRFPLILTVAVTKLGDQNSNDLGLTNALVWHPRQVSEAKKQEEEERKKVAAAGGDPDKVEPKVSAHALLVTEIVELPDDKGKKRSFAIVRDANFAYRSALVPLDSLTDANKYYAEKVYKGNETVNAPPYSYLER